MGTVRSSRERRPRRAALAVPVALLAAVLATIAPGPGAAQDPFSCPANLDPGSPADCTEGGGPDAGAAPGARLPDTSVGNPISLVTGNKRQREIDLDLGGAALGFSRHYASANADANAGLGHGWRRIRR